jgi:SAM-dependent methyltransferase
MSLEGERLRSYYEALGRWTTVSRHFGYGGGREHLTIHRALADPAAGGRPTPTRLHDIVLEAIGPIRGPRVLDAGCGLGGTMIDLHRRVGGIYDGLTLSHAQAATGRRAVEQLGLGGEIRFHVQSYDRPPAGPFDLIVAIESLAHSARPAVSVASLAAVLAPGGRLVIVDDMPEPSATDATRAPATGDDARDLETFRTGWQCPVLWTASQYGQALAHYGLRLVRDVDLSPSCRPRSLARLRWLERLNRGVRPLVPAAAWRLVLDSYLAGLALERLCRRGVVRYRMLVAERVGSTFRPGADVDAAT